MGCSCLLNASRLVMGGNIHRQHVEIGADEFIVNGVITGDQTVIIDNTIKFSGTGTIQAPIITIDVSAFEFSGTLICKNICTIRTTNKCDLSKFLMKGGGIFDIKRQYNGERNDIDS